MLYKTAGKTQKLYSKEKNGDSFIIEDLKEEKVLIGLVSDGVGGRPCDWLASDVTCNKFCFYFKQNKKLSIESRIELSIKQINDLINELESECQGMCATLSLVVWQYGVNKCFYVNIGDSRIYKNENSIFTQLSIDDTEGRSEKINNAIGMSPINISINETSFTNGQSMVLASDGFYRASSYNRDIQKVCSNKDIQKSLDKLFNDYDFMARDDMTAVIIKSEIDVK